MLDDQVLGTVSIITNFQACETACTNADVIQRRTGSYKSLRHAITIPALNLSMP